MVLIHPIVEHALNAPWHFAKGIANLAAAPIGKIMGTDYEYPIPQDKNMATAAGLRTKEDIMTNPKSVYDIANPMMDIATFIYYYTELRSATNKRLMGNETLTDPKNEGFAFRKKLTYGFPNSDLWVLRNALQQMHENHDAVQSTSTTTSTNDVNHVINRYSKSLEEIENLKKRFNLTDGDIKVLETYFHILAAPKNVDKIKSDIELYSKYMNPLFLVAFGGKEFNLNSIIDMVNRDPGMIVYHIDDDFVSTSFDARGFINQLKSEIVYAILISKKAKRITVVFRGSMNANDWMANVQFDMVDFKLPGNTGAGASSKDSNRKIYGKVHEGFYEYLFGRTQQGPNGSVNSKGEEIIGILTTLFTKKKFKDYSLFVTGHSLGGALSTMFAFRAAALGDNLPMVTNVSFASPFVGDQGFRDEFYKLEKAKKIRHLRISNDEDIVPLIPPASKISSIPEWAPFKHTGMNIHLYDEERFLMPKYRLFYPKKGSLPIEMRNAVVNNIVLGLSIGFVGKHACPEYSARLDNAKHDLKKISLDGLYADENLTGWTLCQNSEPETHLGKQ